MTPQEIFDKTVQMLAAQGGPSVNSEGSCQYRGGFGRRCAVGLWISDPAYSSEFEGISVSPEAGDLGDSERNHREALLRKALPAGLLPHLPLLKELQGAHDYATHDPSPATGQRFWIRRSGGGESSIRARLLTVAVKFNLSAEVVDIQFPQGCGDCWPNKPCWNATVKCCKEA